MTYQSELSYINLCLESSSFNYTNVKAFNTVNLFDCESVTFCVFSKTIFISSGYVDILYSTQTRFWGYIGITLPVYSSVCVHPSIFLVSATSPVPILLKLYTVVVYHLRMCMKEDNPGLKNIKGDNLKEIIIGAGQGVSIVD